MEFLDNLGLSGVSSPPSSSQCPTLLPVLLETLSDCPTKRDLAVVDSDVESTVRIVADPCFVSDRCPVTPVVGERQQNTFAALLTGGKFPVVHDSSPLPATCSCCSNTPARRTHAGPRVLRLKGLFEFVDRLEVLDAVTVVRHQQANLDQNKNYSPDIFR